MMLGGSPICVAAPPIFENITSAIIKGIGSRFRTLAICIVTGTIRSIVVTLSKNAEKTAVIVQSIIDNLQMDQPLNAYACTAAHSKTPVFPRISTITIIPISRPIVSSSIQVTTVPRSGPFPMTWRVITATIPPTAAARALWTTSKTISA